MNFKKLCFLNMQRLTNFPYIEADFDALTNYELLSKVVEYLNKVIANENNQNEAINELAEAFTNLKNYVDNYFNNLDIQDEINNKLDEMAEQGQLTDIIAQYLGLAGMITFNTVAEMKLADNLVNGSKCCTLGYHTVNDGGQAFYKVRQITNDDVVDNMFIVELNDNNLIGELIYNEINIKQLGAYGDNIHDDTIYLQTALSKNNCSIYIPSGTYLINDDLSIGSNLLIYGDGSSSILKCNTNLNGNYLINIPITSRFCTIRNLYINGNFMCNGIYDGQNVQPNVQTRTSIENCEIYNCIIGIYLNSIGSNVSNIYMLGEYTLDNTGRCDTGIYINSTDNKIYNCRIGAYSNYGIYCNNSSNTLKNVKCSLNGVGFYLKGTNLMCDIESQENFHDNIKMYRVYGSTITLNSGGAGVVAKNGEPSIPITLNNYSLLDIEECNSTSINCSLESRQSYGDTWSCEGNIIKLNKCIGLTIIANSYTGNETATAMPKLINSDTITGNDITINGIKAFNSLRKRNVTLSGTSNITINYQDDDIYNFTISPSASGGLALVSFPYTDMDYLSILSNISEYIKISQITFRYTINGTNKSIPLVSNTRQLNTSNSCLYRIIENISDTLLNNSTYQTDLASGNPISDKKIFLNVNIGTYTGNRTNIPAKIEVYYN